MKKIVHQNLLFLVLILPGLFQFKLSFADIAATPSLTITLDKSSDCVQSGNSSNVNLTFKINDPQSGDSYWFRLHYVVGGNETTPADFNGSQTSWVATPSASGYYYGELFKDASTLLYTTQPVNFNLTTVDKPIISFYNLSVCLSEKAHASWNYKVTNYQSNHHYILYIKGYNTSNYYRLSDSDFIDNGGGSYTNVVDDYGLMSNKSNSSQSRLYKVIDSISPTCSAESDPITVTFKYNPMSEKGLEKNIRYSDGNYILNNQTEIFDNIPGSGVTWNSFTCFQCSPLYGQGIYSSSGNWVVNPNQFSSGTTIDVNSVQYKVTINGCSYTDTLKNTKFLIFDDKALLPDFIKSSTAPICETYKFFFYMTASVNPSCITTQTDPIQLKLSYKDKDTVVVGTYGGVDHYTNNYLYNFKIQPYRHTGLSVPVTINTVNSSSSFCTPTFYTGKIPIYPANTPKYSGLPDPIKVGYYDYVHLCSASQDTIFLRATPTTPQVGTYSFYLLGNYNNSFLYYIKSLTLADLTGSTSYHAPADDPALIKFVPADVFRRVVKPYGKTAIVSIQYQSPNPCAEYIYRYIVFDSTVTTSVITAKDTICLGDTLSLKVTPGNNEGTSFSWDFGDDVKTGFVLNDTIETHYYDKPGKYLLRFKTNFTSLPIGTCNNDLTDTIFVGAKPKANFDITNNFIGYKSKLNSKSTIPIPNTSVNDDVITNWTWKLGNGDIINDVPNPDTAYTYTNFLKDPYALTHTVTTHWGCTDSITRYIPVFPVKIPTVANPVSDEFNQSDLNGWYQSGQYKVDTVSSWLNIVPNSPNINGGTEAWITAKNNNNPNDHSGYFNDEKSHVDGPVYDITNLQLPMVSVDTWRQLDNYFDGVSLQYAFVDNVPFGKETWHTLGEKDSGLNWYNSNSIISNPGGSFLGWTDTTNSWVLSAYSLKELKDSISLYNKTKARFRIVVGVNKGNAPGFHDGFAFDNFFVGERNRRVIVEEFCDMNHSVTGIDQIYEDPQGINIQYHVNTLSNDTVYNQNPAEPSARALYYGIGTGLPRGVIDGVLEKNDKDFKDWGPDDFFKRSLIISPFNITIDPLTVNNGKLKINATVSKIPNTPLIKNPLMVQVAVVDTKVEVLDANNTPKTFKNVLRNYLPNAAGNRVDQNFDWATSTFNVNHTWQPVHKPDSAVIVVVFVQDENTKEIYQSQKMTLSAADANFLTQAKTAVVNAAFQPSFNEMYIAPNPTSGDLKVMLNGIAIETYTWRVLDELGMEVKSGEVVAGTNALFIHTDELRNGMYVLSMEGEGQRIIKKFSVIR